MMYKQFSRPHNYNFDEPDELWLRCKNCNKDGFNRTGSVKISTVGASVVCYYAVRCKKGCFNGISRKFLHVFKSIYEGIDDATADQRITNSL